MTEESNVHSFIRLETHGPGVLTAARAGDDGTNILNLTSLSARFLVCRGADALINVGLFSPFSDDSSDTSLLVLIQDRVSAIVAALRQQNTRRG